MSKRSVRGYASTISTPAHQRERSDPRQVENNAGGFVYEVDDWVRLERFLVLGSDTNTYYQGRRELTLQNAACVERCLSVDAERTVNAIATVSETGRAPKNDPAIFALALASEYDGGERRLSTEAAKEGGRIDAALKDDVRVRGLALNALGRVCRTGTHLFQFLEFKKAVAVSKGRKTFRRGKNVARAIERWFGSKPVDKAALQMIKYRQRAGWTQGDVLGLFHPNPRHAVDVLGMDGGRPLIERLALYQWGLSGVSSYTILKDRFKDNEAAAQLPKIVRDHLSAMSSVSANALAKIVAETNLPWEALPTEFATKPAVREALLPRMGTTAMIRQLGAMTADGVLKPLGDNAKIVVARLLDVENLRRGRVHPFSILLAHAYYKLGRSVAAQQRGKSVTWSPVQSILDALDEAFTLAFETVIPTGKRILFGIDVSGSMTNELLGTGLSIRRGAAALALIGMRTETNAMTIGYASRLAGNIVLGKRSSLDEVEQVLNRIEIPEHTDCAVPITHAMEEGIEVDAFVNITDNETHWGPIHVMDALRRYRAKTGIPAKLVSVGMTATNFTIGDPRDALTLDVAGFDASAPSVIANFIRGNLVVEQKIGGERSEDVEEDSEA